MTGGSSDIGLKGGWGDPREERRYRSEDWHPKAGTLRKVEELALEMTAIIAVLKSTGFVGSQSIPASLIGKRFDTHHQYEGFLDLIHQ
jgi:hypothetical protein